MPRMLICGATFLTLASAAGAQTLPASPPSAEAPVTVELNKLEAAQGSCIGYFVVGDGSADPLKELQLDVFFFDPAGVIARRAALSFTDVRPGRSKVALFDLELPCERIGRLMVNEVIACAKPDGSALEGCSEKLAVSTRANVRFEY